MNTVQILSAIGIEIFLIFLTALFLLRPKFIFQNASERFISAARWIGMVFLSLTFCWSVILGFVLFINGIEIQL